MSNSREKDTLDWQFVNITTTKVSIVVVSVFVFEIVSNFKFIRNNLIFVIRHPPSENVRVVFVFHPLHTKVKQTRRNSITAGQTKALFFCAHSDFQLSLASDFSFILFECLAQSDFTCALSTRFRQMELMVGAVVSQLTFLSNLSV